MDNHIVQIFDDGDVATIVFESDDDGNFPFSTSNGETGVLTPDDPNPDGEPLLR